MVTISQRRYRARTANCAADIAAVLRLRSQVFRADAQSEGHLACQDADRFDDLCHHVLIEDSRTGDLVGGFRLLTFTSGAEINKSYSAQFYNLEKLAVFPRPMAELGRFCLRPGAVDPDIMRAAWASIAGMVEAQGIEMIFGCTSFWGKDPLHYSAAFAHLRENHLGPQCWRPEVKSPTSFRFDASGPQSRQDKPEAMTMLPPLLRGYLGMGGWVSDHAVVDPDLQTIHVFTALEIDAIPPSRARALRALSRQSNARE